MFYSRRVGKASGKDVTTEIYRLACAKGKVTNKKIPASSVIILRSMYMPGEPIMYRVAYPLSKEAVTWEIADVTEKELVPATRCFGWFSKKGDY